jgi:hypothetical protein
MGSAASAWCYWALTSMKYVYRTRNTILGSMQVLTLVEIFSHECMTHLDLFLTDEPDLEHALCLHLLTDTHSPTVIVDQQCIFMQKQLECPNV